MVVHLNLTSKRGAALVPRRPGFTLVELLIVVTILGIVAAVVINLFSTAADDARASALQMNLHRVREQIMIYYQEHGNTYPQLTNFEQQMTLASDTAGNTAAVGTAGYDFGPYLRDMPPNSFTGGVTVGNGAIGSSDWYYDETTGDFRANDSAASASY